MCVSPMSWKLTGNSLNPSWTAVKLVETDVKIHEVHPLRTVVTNSFKLTLIWLKEALFDKNDAKTDLEVYTQHCLSYIKLINYSWQSWP